MGHSCVFFIARSSCSWGSALSCAGLVMGCAPSDQNSQRETGRATRRQDPSIQTGANGGNKNGIRADPAESLENGNGVSAVAGSSPGMVAPTVDRAPSDTPDVPPPNSQLSGWDPGMKRRLIASTIFGPTFFESCPDSPTGRCADIFQAGQGFYTITAGEQQKTQTCLVNSGAPYYHNAVLTSVPCPYYFRWKSSGGMPVANLKIDALAFSDRNSDNMGIGIGQLIATNTYAGLSIGNSQHSPLLLDILSIQFDFRARLCVHPNEAYVARVASYISFWNQARGQGGEVSVGLIDSFYQPNVPRSLIPIPETISSEDQLGGPASMSTTLHINGKWFGVIPQHYGYAGNTANNCSDSIENARWQHVNIPLQALFSRLVDAHRVDPNVLGGARFTGGLMAVAEQWGRLQNELEIKNYRIYLKK